MTSRQIGPLLLRAQGLRHVNQATHEHKEEIKVGYNLQRKVVLMSIWALSPLAAAGLEPTLFGMFEPHADDWRSSSATSALLWLALGVGGLLFRTVQLFFIRDVQTGLVWVDQDPHRPVPRHQALPQGAAVPAARRADRPDHEQQWPDDDAEEAPRPSWRCDR